MLCCAAGPIASQAAAGGVMLTVVHELVSSLSGQTSTVCDPARVGILNVQTRRGSAEDC